MKGARASHAGLGELIARLSAATPAPPAGATAPVIAQLGAELVSRRLPIIEEILRAIDAGLKPSEGERARLVEILDTDARWREALEAARAEISRQLVAVRKLEAQGEAAAAAADRTAHFVDIDT
ncbi:MAG: hypothetical protein HY698_08165 [Deltaproteobacteria bacterium]|nr:hypothetical protein [Deltaproteobacteria bacterium]